MGCIWEYWEAGWNLHEAALWQVVKPAEGWLPQWLQKDSSYSKKDNTSSSRQVTLTSIPEKIMEQDLLEAFKPAKSIISI